MADRGVRTGEDEAMALEVDRGELARIRIVDDPVAAPADGEAVVRVDAFALTANNITYGAYGDMLGYWDFFPAAPAEGTDGAEVSAAGWGRIPVWGFAEVTESRATGVAEGDRFYGYWPMAAGVAVVPGRVDHRGCTDEAPHRAGKAAAYNHYTRTTADPAYDPAREGQQALLYPLFFTSFLIDDALGDATVVGADPLEQVVLSSASAKTSIGAAFQAHARGGLRVVGLTSPGNVGFVRDLGLYDEVRTYDEVGGLDRTRSAFVDVAGDAAVAHAVHSRLDDALAYSMVVGATHWDRPAGDLGPRPGPEPQFFFAPTQAATVAQRWGPGGLDQRLGEAWARYVAFTDDWLEIRHAHGADEVVAVYRELLEGRIDPRVGHICSLAPTGADQRSTS